MDNRSQIQEIKDRLNILNVAQSYMGGEFKKSGTNFFARCPFHSEKTPSFAVNPDLGIYKCFGCGEAGDVISFIQKMEGLEFRGALELAAKKAGVTLRNTYTPQEEKIFKAKQDLLKLNELVCAYYQYILLNHKAGEKGREYAQFRYLTPELIQSFKIGFAPYSYSNLVNYLNKKGYTNTILLSSGIAVERNGKIIDKFRSRLIFPLINHHNEVVGFSGRTILKDTKAPKYLHSPQTVLFNKSEYLFGLYQAKESIRQKGFVVFCEGQMDAISSYKTSIKNIVASLGTSLTVDQLKLAKRYTSTIYFSFDTDRAGEIALLKAIQLAHTLEFSVKAVSIPSGKDSDELINTDSKKWEQVVENAEPVIDHIINRLQKRLDLSNIKAKEEFLLYIFPLLISLPQTIEQMHYIHKISVILDVDETILVEELSRYQKSNISQINTSLPILKENRNTKEEYLLALLFQNNQFLNELLPLCSPEYCAFPSTQSMLNELKTFMDIHEVFDLKLFSKSLDEKNLQYVKLLMTKDLPYSFQKIDLITKEISSIMYYLELSFVRRQLRLLKQKQEKIQSSEDTQELNEILNQLKSLSIKLGILQAASKNQH